ncbi:hypothetical protein [Pelagibius marinus]|uniref:hypothetical protein n=1 Tax=Pelagibius marinus TaxID=2762760 RepID=UPI00187219EC|nr:hypothetical protein [Pelagibius marinus]
MFHDLTPILVDPMLLAETIVPSIYQAAGLERGELKVTYDATLQSKPLRIQASEDAIYEKGAGKRRIEDVFQLLDDTLSPFKVAFMKADVRQPALQPWPIDLVSAVAGMQMFYLRAQSCSDLLGETLDVVVSISLPMDGVAKVRAQVDVYLRGEGKAAPEQTAALQEYTAAVQVFWNRLASTVFGHWARDNGVSELRLAAEILVDPRQAKAAVGRLIEDIDGSTVH